MSEVKGINYAAIAEEWADKDALIEGAYEGNMSGIEYFDMTGMEHLDDIDFRGEQPETTALPEPGALRGDVPLSKGGAADKESK